MKLVLPTIAFLLMTTTVLSAADAPTGASLAWTSEDPVVTKARELILRGELSKAEAVLRGTPAVDPRATDETFDLIRRIRHDYSLTSAGLVAKLKSQIPGVQAADLEAWREAGQLQYRTIDGEITYFCREPSNLFRFFPPAVERRGRQGGAPGGGFLGGPPGGGGRGGEG